MTYKEASKIISEMLEEYYKKYGSIYDLPEYKEVISKRQAELIDKYYM